MRKEQQHICFDLETFGNNPSSPIIQIGAVKFDIDRGIYDSFEMNVEYNSDDELFNKFKFNYSTILWWMQQNKNVISKLDKKPKMNLYDSITQFFNWVGIAPNYLFWSHATFDGPILRSALDILHMHDKIPYRNYKDVRTIVDLFDIDIPEIDIDKKHIALHDATYEANQVLEGLKKVFYL